MEKDTSAILVCGGNSTRMGKNKILLPLGETNVVGASMQALEQCDSIFEIIVVARKEDHATILETVKNMNITKFKTITEGGETRQQSVINGIRESSREGEYVAVHDGARPLVRPADIEHVIKDARVFGGATLGVPVKDTIKVVEDGLIEDTPPRSKLFITQTPQVFRRRLYLEAVDFSMEHGLDFTDDCQMVEAMGYRICMTTGSYTNLKLTTPEDIIIAERLYEKEKETQI